jgi:hypothetical protein
MKKVVLTNFERKVILEALTPSKICEAACFCDYKRDLCNQYDSSGQPRCKLVRAIHSIEDKVGC